MGLSKGATPHLPNCACPLIPMSGELVIIYSQASVSPGPLGRCPQVHGLFQRATYCFVERGSRAFPESLEGKRTPTPTGLRTIGPCDFGTLWPSRVPVWSHLLTWLCALRQATSSPSCRPRKVCVCWGVLSPPQSLSQAHHLPLCPFSPPCQPLAPATPLLLPCT